MKTNEQLLNNVIGQLEGVKKMISSSEEPFAVLTQMKAARSALQSSMQKYIQQHFWEIVSTCDDKDEACKKFLQELLAS